MAKVVDKVNKSAMIRDIAAANPNLKPKEIADQVSKAAKQAISPMYVSTVLSNGRKKAAEGGTPGTRGRKARGPVTADLLAVKKFCQSVGGISAVRSALDTLDQLASVV